MAFMPDGARLAPRSILLALAAVLAVGCATTNAYRDPITKYQQASTVVTELARVEYRDANRRERNAEIDRRVERREAIDLKLFEDPKYVVLDEAGMQARLDALDALAKHGTLMLALANADSPGRAKAAATSLDEAVVKLRKAAGDEPSSDFSARANAFTAIAGEIVQLVLQRQLTKALDRGIIASNDSVPGLIAALREDMTALHARKRSMLGARRVRAVDEYADQLAKKPYNAAATQKAADALKDIQDEWDKLPSMLGSGKAFDAMAAAQAALVAFAESPKKPQDVDNVLEATDAFAESAKVIADSIKTIRQGA